MQCLILGTFPDTFLHSELWLSYYSLCSQLGFSNWPSIKLVLQHTVDHRVMLWAATGDHKHVQVYVWGWHLSTKEFSILKIHALHQLYLYRLYQIKEKLSIGFRFNRASQRVYLLYISDFEGIVLSSNQTIPTFPLYIQSLIIQYIYSGTSS